MLELKDKVCRYKVFNFFLTEIYSNICGNEAKGIILNFLKAGNKNLDKCDLEILQRYASGKISDKIFFAPGTEISVINTHIWFMNSINWLFSIRQSESPLSSIFFDKGQLPASFSKHIEEQFLICGT